MSKENGLALLARLHSTKRKGTTANSLRRHRHNSESIATGDGLFQMPLEENTDFLYYQSREISMDSAEYLCLNGLLNMPHSCDEDHGLASGNSKTSPNQQQKHVQEKSLHLPLPCPSPDGRAYHDSEASTPVTRSTKGLSFDVDRIVDDRLRSRLLRNRACAERSRLRRKAALADAEVLRAKLEGECEVLQEENGALRRQLELLQVCRICAAVLCVWPRASALCDIHRFSHALCPEQRRRRASSRSSSRRGPAPRRGTRGGAPAQREQTEAGSDGVSHERDEPASAPNLKPGSKTGLKNRRRPAPPSGPGPRRPADRADPSPSKLRDGPRRLERIRLGWPDGIRPEGGAREGGARGCADRDAVEVPGCRCWGRERSEKGAGEKGVGVGGPAAGPAVAACLVQKLKAIKGPAGLCPDGPGDHCAQASRLPSPSQLKVSRRGTQHWETALGSTQVTRPRWRRQWLIWNKARARPQAGRWQSSFTT